MTYISNIDSTLQISRGRVAGQSVRVQFGRNYGIGTADVPAQITNIGSSNYFPPTSAQPIVIVSTSADDDSNLNATGTISVDSLDTIVDSSATFVTSGVASGDVVLNDTTNDHSLVVSVDSETQLTIIPMHHNKINSVGDIYRIVQIVGNGCSVVHVDGLDADGNVQREFVLMTGITSLQTVNNYTRINEIHCHGCGSFGYNGGDISATAKTDGTVVAMITTAKGRSENGYFTVPKGKTAFITGISCSLFRSGAASDAMASISLNRQLWSLLGYGNDAVFELGMWSCSVHNSLTRVFNPYLMIDELSDVWFTVDDVSDNGSILTGEIDMILADNG